MDTSVPGTILVPLDGSRFEMQALPIVQRLALATRARAVLLRIVRNRGPHELSERDAAEQVAAQAAERLRTAGVTAVAEACAGPRLACIVRHATLWRADLIVMADVGRGRLARFLWGGGAGDTLVRTSLVPVMLVPAHPNPPRAPVEGPVLAVVDGSAEDGSTVQHARRLARALSLGIVLLRAVTPPPPVLGTDCVPTLPATDELLLEARGYVRELALGLRGEAGVATSGEAVVGPAAGTIVEHAEAWDAAAIVLGPSAWTDPLLGGRGSVAGRVLARTPRPVLCAPAITLAPGHESVGGAPGATAAVV
ncbi:MAG TPA: universal stress protein [Chloroflexota bacterium]|nr:universal stress protein [Chloroflexota bacterium]